MDGAALLAPLPMSGIDATTELVDELDRLGATTLIARDAPRSPALYSYLALGMNTAPHGQAGDQFTTLTAHLIERLGIWWSPQAYQQMPVMTPWCARDRSCRYDQGPESWGAPRADGYLRDDNSIVKKLPLPVQVTGPADSPYRGRKPLRGFTACHIWRDLPDGQVAGEDPWLYSFMPNLIWLPTWLAPLTDRQGGAIQALLQRTSIARFRSQPVHPAVTPYAERAWRRLPAPSTGAVLPLRGLASFQPDRGFFARRIRYLEKFVEGCDSSLNGETLSKKLISSRYTAELPGLSRANVTRFRNAMWDYRAACYAASTDLDGVQA
jgi:hypothetical protein